MFLIRKIIFSIIGGVIVCGLLFYCVILPLFSWIPNQPVPEDLKDLDKVIVVDRDDQLLYAYEKGKLTYKFLAVTGSTGHQTSVLGRRDEKDTPTPLGKFAVARKVEDHVSGETVGAPMPYSLFFVNHRGIAIHGSQMIAYRWRYNDLSPSSPMGSHGCVSLTRRNARKLYGWAEVGTPVVVIGTEPVAKPDPAATPKPEPKPKPKPKPVAKGAKKG